MVAKKTRRKYDREFKERTVKLITEKGLGVERIARDIDNFFLKILNHLLCNKY
jgi:transposase-like protein